MRRFKKAITIYFLAMFVVLCGTKNIYSQSSEVVKQLILREADEIWSRGNLAAIPELFSDSFTMHYGDKVYVLTHEDYRKMVTTWRTAFPDLKMEVNDIIINGDKAAARYTVTGTHLGELWGYKPTGKLFQFDEIYIVRVEAGKIVETWGVWDEYGFRKQLGFLSGK